MLNDLYTGRAAKQNVVPCRQQRYVKSIKSLDAATAAADQKRLEALRAHFEKYARQYRFDALLLAAQGYRESTLDQSKRSPVGAIGVMQVMPATGASLQVGAISVAEANIHAGAKCMDQLMTRYFTDAKFDEQNRTPFAFASYHAGPGNVARTRKEARQRGLDPDVWFDNVETVTAAKIGIETTTYVRNIFKCDVSYTLASASRAAADTVRKEVVPAPR